MNKKFIISLLLTLAMHEIHVSDQSHLDIRLNLHQAVRNKQIDKINQLLANGADINEKDENGDTPLLIECKYNQDTATDIIKLLLDANANIKQRDAKNFSSMAYTASRGMIQKMRLLIAKIGTLQAHSDIVNFAAQSGNIDMVDTLLAAQAPLEQLGKGPLHIAVSRNDLQMAQHVITKGARIDEEALGFPDCYPLMIAIDKKYYDMIKLLLHHGANPNARRTVKEKTPLMFAVLKEDITSVRMLIDAGANVNDTLIFTENRHPALQAMNQDRAVNPYVDFEESVLRIADKGKNLSIIQLLKSKGAKRNWDCCMM